MALWTGMMDQWIMNQMYKAWDMSSNPQNLQKSWHHNDLTGRKDKKIGVKTRKYLEKQEPASLEFTIANNKETVF